MTEIKCIKKDKKEWTAPEIISLDFKNTEEGQGIGTAEDGTYHPDSNM